MQTSEDRNIATIRPLLQDGAHGWLWCSLDGPN